MSFILYLFIIFTVAYVTEIILYRNTSVVGVCYAAVSHMLASPECGCRVFRGRCGTSR